MRADDGGGGPRRIVDSGAMGFGTVPPPPAPAGTPLLVPGDGLVAAVADDGASCAETIVPLAAEAAA